MSLITYHVGITNTDLAKGALVAADRLFCAFIRSFLDVLQCEVTSSEASDMLMQSACVFAL
jgi:hypothetical protein